MAPAPPRVEYVGRSQFPEALDTLSVLLRDASFVAIDTELSGLSAQLEKPSLVDSVAQRYTQLRNSAQSFAVVQFGLSVFTWRADARAFDVRTFQFPIFPVFHGDVRNHHSELPDRSFLAQAKCLSYIRMHGFDLNAWVDDGIGYLSHDEQAKLAHVLAKPLREDVVAKFRGDSAAPIRTVENEPFHKAMRKKTKQLLSLQCAKDGDADGANAGTQREDERASAARAFLRERLEATSPLVHHVGGTARRAFVTDPQTPFRRSALMAMVEKEFPSVAVLDCPADNDGDAEVEAAPWKRRLRVLALEGNEEMGVVQDAHAELIREEHERRNLTLVGFTAVLDLLTAAAKKTPIVGHNMLLDVMQCFDKFHGPLPESCAGFLHELHSWLGGVRLFDTKVLVEHAMEHVDLFGERLEHSALEYVFQCVSKSPFQGPALQEADTIANPGEKRNKKTAPPLSAHQAGYDAYMTGVVFLRVCSGLGVPNEAVGALSALTNDCEFPPRWQETLLRLRDTLTLGQLLPPVSLTLPGPFPDEVETPSRAHILRATLTRAWTAKLKPFHVQQCVGWALGLRAIKLVRVRYENKHSVFIQLPRADQVDELFRIRHECKEVHGSDKDPLPSLGCLDLSRIEDAVAAESDGGTLATDKRASKRQRVDGE